MQASFSVKLPRADSSKARSLPAEDIDAGCRDASRHAGFSESQPRDDPSMNVLQTLIALIMAASIITSAAASQYTPPGLYDADYRVLTNGLGLVFKPRGEARNTAIRLVVNVGTHRFPCGKRELPHFLEHLLFTGTSTHTEAELDDLIEEQGGIWNARTEPEKTVYEIDIYSLAQEQQADFRREFLGFIFQDFYLVPYLSVLENVLLPSAEKIAEKIERSLA